MKPPIDLRSDTVTQPTDAMRRAMAEAVVGDDVYGEDPTVRRLEEESAAAMGCEAAVFVPSGTMGNQIAMHLHTRPGDEVLVEESSHMLHYEMGALAAISGAQVKPLPSRHGLLEPETVTAAIVRGVPYHSSTAALVVENTHNLAGGTLYDRGRLERLIAVARSQSLRLHLDGARIWNAATALSTTPDRLAAGFDSVMFCLSKGLGAPVGSLLCGKSDFIAEARRVRKMLGGGMRQVGVLAAAGLIALREGPRELEQDHRNAALLGSELSSLPGIEVVEPGPQTNILICRVPGSTPADLARTLAAEGVLAVPLVGERIRFVTHRDVNRAQVLEAARTIARVLSSALRNSSAAS
jgi:threonine aldolase